MKAKRILVIGGSVAGLSAAISCRNAGHDVEVVEIDPNWQVAGAGITINASTLRALGILGVLGEVLERGYFGHGNDVCNVDGLIVESRDGIRIPLRSLPSGGGILRPVLHDILSRKALSLGISVRAGVTYDRLDNRNDGVSVTFTDGSIGDYDIAVGADGLFSKVRSLLFPKAARPAFTGQGCWRVVVPRPEEISRSQFYVGGDCAVGAVPVSQDEMYVWVLESAPDNPWIDAADQPRLLADLLEPFGGVLADVKSGLNANSQILYRPLEAILLPAPWYRDRVLLIGDAAHATTPHLASGAGLAIEDGIALAEELMGAADIGTAFEAFCKRRYARCEMVVNSSIGIGDAQIARDVERAQAIFPAAWAALTNPF